LLLLSVSMNVSLYNTDLAMGKCSPAHIVLCNESTLQAQIPYLLWGQIDCWGGLRFPAVVNFRWPCSWTLLRFFFCWLVLFLRKVAVDRDGSPLLTAAILGPSAA
jgi:hypothetical protein